MVPVTAGREAGTIINVQLGPFRPFPLEDKSDFYFPRGVAVTWQLACDKIHKQHILCLFPVSALTKVQKTDVFITHYIYLRKVL